MTEFAAALNMQHRDEMDAAFVALERRSGGSWHAPGRPGH